MGLIFDSITGHGLIELPVISSPFGKLTFCESNRHIPFEIARSYLVYDVPDSSERGGHAHRYQMSVIFAMHGRFRVTVNDGRKATSYWLDSPHQGLYMGKMLWRDINSYSGSAVCGGLSSGHYDEGDYIRDWDSFVAEVRTRNA